MEQLPGTSRDNTRCIRRLFVQVTAKSWAIIWWIWSSYVTSLNYSEADSVKLFSLFRAVQQIASAPPLDLRSVRLSLSDWLEQIYAPFFLPRILFLNIDGLQYELKYFHFPEFFCYPPPLPLIHELRENSLSCMCILHHSCHFFPQQNPFILK